LIQLIDANASHAEAIARIHNHAVLHSTAIWYDTPISVESRAAFIKSRQDAGFPFITAVDHDGAVLGYASYGEFRAFSGYRHTVEHLVYVAETAQRQGIASKLMHALMERAQNSQVHAMVGAIESGNLASLELHRRLGFTEVGRMPEVGIKFGRWLDLSLMQKLL
jgi:phosphinothricin acetyltransferase